MPVRREGAGAAYPPRPLIAALGSSFAAGPGIMPVVNEGAMRSGRNYAHQLASRLNADLVDLTVSGATTANVLDTPQQTSPEIVFAPQLDDLPKRAAFVTVTAGGNDLQFAGAMLALAWERTDPQSHFIPLLGGPLLEGVPDATPARVEQATSGLAEVVTRARLKAHGCRVLLVDYLTVLDERSQASTPFTDDEFARLLSTQAAIRKVFWDAAERTDADLVRASMLSATHALGSPQPWVQPFQQDPELTFGSFHPNETGMAAIAADLERLIRETA